jgi:hypothetical protein
MTTNFPAIAPTRRSYVAPQFPTKRFTSISGAGVTRLYGSKSFGAQLNLEFVLADAETATILNCYQQARGDSDDLLLPNALFDGMATALRNQIPDHLTWRWADTPTVQSLFDNRSRLQVSLIGTLDG